MAAMEEDLPQFDLENLMAGYTGAYRFNRLLYIAEKKAGSDQAVELEALKMAHDEAKRSENTAVYQAAVERIRGRVPGYSLDRSWSTSAQRSSDARREALEAELNSHKAALIKESIRLSHTQLGDHLYSRGDLQEALKAYIRSRDYCTSGRHIVSMCLAIIKTSCGLQNYMHIGNYVAKAENTQEGQNDPVVKAQLAAASGLGMLAGRRFKLAGRKFLEVTADLGNTLTDVVAMQDVALYASLCALATFDRGELYRKLITNIAFKEVLESAPEMRDIAQDFYACRYAKALAALTALSPTLTLDPYLGPHLDSLLHQIRQRAIVQYTSPFTSVRLSSMAAAFNTTAQDLAKEIASLIMDGAIAARIDAHAGVLYAKKTDVRTTTFSKALSASQQLTRETKAALLRVDLLKHDFVQKPPKGELGPGGGGRQRGKGPAGELMNMDMNAFEGGAGMRMMMGARGGGRDFGGFFRNNAAASGGVGAYAEDDDEDMIPMPIMDRPPGSASR